MNGYDSPGEKEWERKTKPLVGNLSQFCVVHHKYHTESSEIESETPLVTAAQRPNRKCRATYLLVYTNMHFRVTYTYLHTIYSVLSNLFVIFEDTVL